MKILLIYHIEDFLSFWFICLTAYWSVMGNLKPTFDTNDLHIVIWFQVSLYNNNNNFQTDLFDWYIRL